jgi:hypothetical protein
MFHAVIGQHYARKKARIDGTPVDDWATPEQAIELVRNDGPIQREWADRILEAGEDYAKFYRAETWKPVGVEHLQQVTWMHEGKRIRYCQSVDLIIIWKGLVYLVDHKTTYRLPKHEKRIMGMYRLSGQMIGYHLLGRARFGAKFGGVILNFINMPQGKKTAFQRVIHEVPLGAIETFRQTVQMSRAARDRWEGVPAMERPGVWNEACYGKWGPCAHVDTCARGFE